MTNWPILLALSPIPQRPISFARVAVFSRLARAHTLEPKNRRPLLEANAKGASSYRECNDTLNLYLLVREGRIEEATFESKACGAAVAMASIGTESLKGMEVGQALGLTAFDWDEKVGGFPPAKRHAILLFMESLHQALEQL